MNENTQPEPKTPDTPLDAAAFEKEVAAHEHDAPPLVADAPGEPASTWDAPSDSEPLEDEPHMLTPAEDPTDETAREAPRALSPGALLQGEYEIKEVLARGLTNIYHADSGGYGPPQPWILAERVLPPEPASASPEPESEVAAVAEPESPEEIAEETDGEESSAEASPEESAPEEDAPAAEVEAEDEERGEIPLSELARSSGLGLTDEGEFEHARESGGLGSEAGVYDAPVEVQTPLELSTAAASSSVEPSGLFYDPEPMQPVRLRPADSVRLDLVHAPPNLEIGDEAWDEDFGGLPALLEPGEVWEQDGRQYCAWDWAATTSLQDFRDATNDELYFQVLGRVSEAMAWQKERGRILELNRDTLRFDESGQVRFYGFSSPLEDADELLNQLRGVSEFLLKHTFANSGTMRLDDPFAGLPLAEETKQFAHGLSEGEFDSFEAAHAALQVLAGARELELSVALITDVGQQRELNEDAGLIARCSRKTSLSPLEWELLVVADGMGGHEGGEIASDLTVRVLHQQLLEAAWDWRDNASVRAGMLAAITDTNARVAALAEEPRYKGSRSRPGSTLTFAVRVGRRVWIGNVGDSRTYIFRNGELKRVTKDHSYVQNLIDAGALDPEDAWDHPDGSIITAHIGEANLKTRDVFTHLLLPGDKLLLVSDGVIDMLRDSEIAPFLQHEQPGAICRGLVDAANAAGGADNITALCLCCY